MTHKSPRTSLDVPLPGLLMKAALCLPLLSPGGVLLLLNQCLLLRAHPLTG